MTKHQPATLLPWNVGDDRKMRQQQAAQGGAVPIFTYSKAHDCNLAAMDLRGNEAADVRANAAYIAHACNAYPRLVGRLHNHLLAHSIAESHEDFGDAREIVCTCQQCSATRALLAELGE